MSFLRDAFKRCVDECARVSQLQGIGCVVRSGEDAGGFEIVEGLFQPFARLPAANFIRLHKEPGLRGSRWRAAKP